MGVDPKVILGRWGRIILTWPQFLLLPMEERVCHPKSLFFTARKGRWRPRVHKSCVRLGKAHPSRAEPQPRTQDNPPPSSFTLPSMGKVPLLVLGGHGVLRKEHLPQTPPFPPLGRGYRAGVSPEINPGNEGGEGIVPAGLSPEPELQSPREALPVPSVPLTSLRPGLIPVLLDAVVIFAHPSAGSFLWKGGKMGEEQGPRPAGSPRAPGKGFGGVPRPHLSRSRGPSASLPFPSACGCSLGGGNCREGPGSWSQQEQGPCPHGQGALILAGKGPPGSGNTPRGRAGPPGTGRDTPGKDTTVSP